MYRACQPGHLVGAPTESSAVFARSLAAHVTGHDGDVPVGNAKYAHFGRTKGDFTLHSVTKPTDITMHVTASICHYNCHKAPGPQLLPRRHAHPPKQGCKQRGRAGHFGRTGATRRSACIGHASPFIWSTHPHNRVRRSFVHLPYT